MAHNKGTELVRDIMTTGVKTIAGTANLQELAKLMSDHDIGAVPVVEVAGNGKVIGIVTDRDIVIRAVAQGKVPAEVEVSHVMSSRIFTVREDDDLDKVFALMSEKQVRRVPVVDAEDRIVGIIAQADVATESDESKKVANVIESISEPAGNH